MSKIDRYFEHNALMQWISAALVVGVLWLAFEVGEAKVRGDADETRRGAFFDFGD